MTSGYENKLHPIVRLSIDEWNEWGNPISQFPSGHLWARYPWVPVNPKNKGYWKCSFIGNGLKFGAIKSKTELKIKIDLHLHDKLVCKRH